jgi:hypothetical protein
MVSRIQLQWHCLPGARPCGNTTSHSSPIVAYAIIVTLVSCLLCHNLVKALYMLQRKSEMNQLQQKLQYLKLYFGKECFKKTECRLGIFACLYETTIFIQIWDVICFLCHLVNKSSCSVKYVYQTDTQVG